MLALFQKLFFGHVHEWEIINTTNVYFNSGDSLPMGQKYTLQCKICGNIKIKKTY